MGLISDSVVACLVPALGVDSILLPVWHLIRLQVHASRRAEDVLFYAGRSVQNDLRLVRLPPVHVVDRCMPAVCL